EVSERHRVVFVARRHGLFIENPGSDDPNTSLRGLQPHRADGEPRLQIPELDRAVSSRRHLRGAVSTHRREPRAIERESCVIDYSRMPYETSYLAPRSSIPEFQ